ncbi:MAG: hypothetical protein AAF264_02750 [Pseudomonadota bacterium]
MSESPFFVGYLPLPRAWRGLYALLIVGFVVVFGAIGFLVGASQDAPEAAGFRFDYGRQTVTGVIEMSPYPILHVTEGTDRIPAGRSLLMSGQGKTGIDARLAPMAGGLAQVSGVALERGTIDLLQVRGGQAGLSAVEETAPDIPVEPLGRWRLAGEICDGKCLTGAMRPGRGLAHKACANLCILGEVPPVFVSSQPVEGTDFLLITGPDATPLPRAAYDRIGQYISVEGDLERRGDLVVLRMDPESMELIE